MTTSSTCPRFFVAEIEDKDGNITEYIAEDRMGNYDPSSFDTYEEALEEVEIMQAQEGVK